MSDADANTTTPARARQLFKDLNPERKRKPLPRSVITDVIRDLDKLGRMPFKKKKWTDLIWGENPNDLESLTIDIPEIKLKTVSNKDWSNLAVYYTPERCIKEGFRFIKKSCVITHNNEIVGLYIKGEDDPAINTAVKHLQKLQEQMATYYPVKTQTFYSNFSLTKKDATVKEKQQATQDTKKMKSKGKYQGLNWMDGMIKYFLGAKDKQGGTIVSYHPRKPEADEDKDFLYNLVYSYSALYELEKRYTPTLAKHRLELAKKAGFPGAFPNFPLDRHPATTCGSSINFASAIHNDSGLEGLAETIIWTKCKPGEHQFFVSPNLKLAFDLSHDNAIIFQPPKVAHGTINTGDHGGVGIVNITKANLVSPTDLNRLYYDLYKKELR
jgi:hypothetical protein